MEKMLRKEPGAMTIKYIIKSFRQMGLFLGEVEDSTQCTCKWYIDDEKVNFWYNYAMSHTSEFLLRIFGKIIDDERGTLCLISEVYDITLKEWANENDIITFGELNPIFRHILEDIIQVLWYLSAQNSRHGELKEENIVLHNNRAKLMMVDLKTADDERCFRKDCRDLGEMIKSLLRSQRSSLPLQLDLFIDTLNSITSSKQIPYLLKHPIFISSDERLDLLFCTETRTKYKGLSVFLEGEIRIMLKEKQRNEEWVKNVRHASPIFMTVLNLPSFEMYKDTIGDYLKFAKNAYLHIIDDEKDGGCYMAIEAIAKNLEEIFPGFVSMVHHAFMPNNC